MPEVPVNLHFIEATFSVGASVYTEHITGCEFVPTAASVEVLDLGGKTHKRTGKASWVANLDLIQDWTTTGLAAFMFEHEGELADISYTGGDGAQWDAKVILKAPNIGGKSGTIGASALSLDVDGRPIRTAPADGE